MKYNPHPKQKEFLEDDRPRILYGGGQPTRGHYNWVMKAFLREVKMQGYIRNLVLEKGYGFISCPESKIDYFFHRDDFNGHWEDLKIDYINSTMNQTKIDVEFEVTDKGKGPRAESVRRIQWPNEG